MSNQRKMLITGASGFLGSRIASYYKDKYKVLTPTHGEMDITDERNVVQYFKTYMPEIVIHCAAVADVGTCERELERSWKINVTGTENIVKAAKAVGAICLCCSSDQVYCGIGTMQPNKEADKVYPTNVYGKEKACAEESCLAIYDKSVHLRLAWMYDVYDEKRMDFIKQLKLSRTKEVVFSPMDHRGITDVWEVVKNIEPALELPGGVYNFGSANDRSTYETVLNILKEKGYNRSFIRKMENANPRNLTMCQNKLNNHGIYFSTTIEGILKCDFYY